MMNEFSWMSALSHHCTYTLLMEKKLQALWSLRSSRLYTSNSSRTWSYRKCHQWRASMIFTVFLTISDEYKLNRSFPKSTFSSLSRRSSASCDHVHSEKIWKKKLTNTMNSICNISHRIWITQDICRIFSSSRPSYWISLWYHMDHSRYDVQHTSSSLRYLCVHFSRDENYRNSCWRWPGRRYPISVLFLIRINLFHFFIAKFMWSNSEFIRRS